MDARRELARLETILKSADPLSGEWFDTVDAMDRIDEKFTDRVVAEIETAWALELGYTNWVAHCRGWLGSTGTET